MTPAESLDVAAPGVPSPAAYDDATVDDLDIVRVHHTVDQLRRRVPDLRVVSVRAFGFPDDRDRFDVVRRTEPAARRHHRPRRPVVGAPGAIVGADEPVDTGRNWCAVEHRVGETVSLLVSRNGTATAATDVPLPVVVDVVGVVRTLFGATDDRWLSVTLATDGDSWWVDDIAPAPPVADAPAVPVSARLDQAFPERTDGWRTAVSPGVELAVAGDVLLAVRPGQPPLAATETGAFLLAGLADGTSIGDLVAEAQSAFPDAESLAADLTGAATEWIDKGVLQARPGETAPPMPPGPEGHRVGWNPERRYRLGATVRVRGPEPLLEALDRVLDASADCLDDTVADDVELDVTPGGWVVSSSTSARHRVAGPNVAVPAVRRRVLDTASRSSSLLLRASVVSDHLGGTILLGTPAVRAGLLKSWIGTGGRVVADDVVTIDDDGTVAPAFVGIGIRTDRHRFPALTDPADGGVYLDDEGHVVEFHRVPAAFRAGATSSIDRIVVVDQVDGDDDLAELVVGPPSSIIDELLGATAVQPDGVHRLVHLLDTATCARLTASWSQPAVAALRRG